MGGETGRKSWTCKLVSQALVCAFILTGLIACEGFGEDDEGPICCRYERRQTGCGNKGWSSWGPDQAEMLIEDLKPGLSPEEFCETFDGLSTTCGAGCCINIERRNVVMEKGACF